MDKKEAIQAHRELGNRIQGLKETMPNGREYGLNTPELKAARDAQWVAIRELQSQRSDLVARFSSRHLFSRNFLTAPKP